MQVACKVSNWDVTLTFQRHRQRIPTTIRISLQSISIKRSFSFNTRMVPNDTVVSQKIKMRDFLRHWKRTVINHEMPKVKHSNKNDQKYRLRKNGSNSNQHRYSSKYLSGLGREFLSVCVCCLWSLRAKAFSIHEK